ncbi:MULTISPECIES: ligase-associated DNA damage response endonuclease PdeM [unclassified Pseudomonas]|uniref:ligase-associated DNA damage response endonuclease PdeM n=1 Tax=unclassified Pseudomonas TaxID=196821 RepID=UPI002097DF75|nr:MULTISPECIES: ligase-associated DNA damage response endonuclease PdeM [unclassified Pseudomonas]MCO7522200.1 ligase-associated DNA damage response endonuclease PdeM [Pseudomonas sp. 1]MCO7540898.1 ligase-associated DNA damage response endonuclease PdeM [Pseudomonas sp. VA159-2]
MQPLTIEHCGETLWLLPDKALYWPARQALLVADVHIGKAASYRALHQPVPRGTTLQTLERLDRLLASCACSTLIILGDFLHARTGRAAATLAAVQGWRERHRQLQIVLVRGNHDLHAGDPPAALRIQVENQPWPLGPFALQHEPLPHAERPVLAGHVHPVFVLRGRARQRLRLPCFVVGQQVTLLPAFGAFTGGYAVTPNAGDQVYLAAAGQVWPVTG